MGRNSCWPARGPAACRASSADSLQCGHGCHESMSLFSMFPLLRRYGPAGEASPVCKQSRFTSSCAWLESSNKVGLSIRAFEIDEDSVDDDQETGHGPGRCATQKHTNLTSGFCCGPKQLLAGQGAGRLINAIMMPAGGRPADQFPSRFPSRGA